MDKIISTRISFGQKAKDYTYAVLFFMVFSFFLLVVIKPNLSMVFELQSERDRLSLMDKGYTAIIAKIVNVQTVLEDIRGDLHFLNESLPAVPQVNQLVNDINQTAVNSGVTLNGLNINEINLKDTQSGGEKKDLVIDMEITSGFIEMKKFITLLGTQRRLKNIENIRISKDNKAGSASANLRIQMTLESFYL